MVFRNHLHLVNMAAGTVTPLLDADDHTRLIDCGAKKKTLIMSGPSHDFQWLSTEITK